MDLGRKEGIWFLRTTCVTPGVVGMLVTSGGGTATSGNVVETNIWLITRAVTPTEVEVHAPLTIILIGFSAISGASFREMEEFFRRVISTRVLPLL